MSEEDICGSEDTETGEPCQRQPGWGRDAVAPDHGPDYQAGMREARRIIETELFD